MKCKFWGVRGSIATPGPLTVKYGGNTTCIEIQPHDGELIILDAGTGIHALAQSLLSRMPITAHIFITHTHWDHIQGLPFFMPIFITGNRLNIYGGRDPNTGVGIDRALSVQLQHSFFPIIESQLKAKVDYFTIGSDETVQVGCTRISTILLNHPVLNFGYRVDHHGKSLFFTGDYEPPFNPWPCDHPCHAKAQRDIDAKLDQLVRFITEIDVLIIDSAYTEEEYMQRRTWGHGTYHQAIALARRARVKQLILTHHEPTRTDAQLDQIISDLRVEFPELPFTMELAREGMEVVL